MALRREGWHHGKQRHWSQARARFGNISHTWTEVTGDKNPSARQKFCLARKDVTVYSLHCGHQVVLVASRLESNATKKSSKHLA